jgi:hypothetical protein
VSAALVLVALVERRNLLVSNTHHSLPLLHILRPL